MSAGPYGVVYADPPWSFATRSPKGGGRSASRHYAVMPLADIKALPVAALAAPDCALFLWATNPMLPQALEVMAAWGFAYRTVAFCWAKLAKPVWRPETERERRRDSRRGSLPGTDVHYYNGHQFFMGLGYWTRANAELCLLGVRGRPGRLSRAVRQLVVAPRREHSRKPAEVRAGIEALLPGPYVELFARERAPGWDAAHSPEADRFAAAPAPGLAA